MKCRRAPPGRRSAWSARPRAAMGRDGQRPAFLPRLRGMPRPCAIISTGECCAELGRRSSDGEPAFPRISILIYCSHGDNPQRAGPDCGADELLLYDTAAAVLVLAAAAAPNRKRLPAKAIGRALTQIRGQARQAG